jgi:hypothetical protein
MPSRYDTRRIFFNQEALYEEIFDERHVSGIRHYSSPRLGYPTRVQMYSLTKKGHIWSVGDRFYKLAIENYGSAQYWWVIALFNRRPTDADVKAGDNIIIPLPLEKVLPLLTKK